MDQEKLPWLREWNEKEKAPSLEGFSCSSLLGIRQHHREPLLGADLPRDKNQLGPGAKCCAWIPPWTPIPRIRAPEWPSPALPPPVLPKAFPAATAVLGSPDSASSLIYRAGPGRGLGLPATAFPPFPHFRSPCPQPAPCESPLDPSWLFLPPFRGAPAQCWAVLRGLQPLPPGPGASAAKPSRAHLQKWHFGQSFQSASSPAPAAAQVPGMDLQEPGQRL